MNFHHTVSLSGLLAALCLGPSTAKAADDWCVVVSSAPYTAFAKALTAAEGAKAAGFADAAVYDTRDFSDLAWGQLAALATLDASKDAATAAVKALKKAKIKAFARRCTPSERPLKKLSKPEDLAQPAALPTAPLKLDPSAELDYGCFGWSDTEAAAACVVGAISLQGGANAEVAFRGAQGATIPFIDLDPQILDEVPMKVPADDFAELGRRLSAGKYVALTLPRRELKPGESVNYAAPKVGIVWKRKRSGSAGEPESGVWDLYTDSVVATCPGGGKVTLFEDTEVPDREPSAQVIAIPGGRYFVVIHDSSFAIEGDSGGATTAYRLDAQDCKVAE